MRKTLNSKFLSSVLALPAFISCGKNVTPAPKVVAPEDKIYFAVNNMFNLIEARIFKNEPKILHDQTFACAVAELLAVRNESSQNRDSVDSCLGKLFLRQQEMPKGSQNSFIEELKKISEDINKQSNSQFVIMGNTLGERDDFVHTGMAFKSEGIGYALVIYTGSSANVFFSDNKSKNKIFVDKTAKEYDLNEFINYVKNLENCWCTLVPILDLKLKEKSQFVHLGGYCGAAPFGLSMFFSLQASRIVEIKNEEDKAREEQRKKSLQKPGAATSPQKKIERQEIFLYANDRDAALNCDSNNKPSKVNMIGIFDTDQKPEEFTFFYDWFDIFKKGNSFHSHWDFVKLSSEQDFVCFNKYVSAKGGKPKDVKIIPLEPYLVSLKKELKKGTFEPLVGKAFVTDDGFIKICNDHRVGMERRRELNEEIKEKTEKVEENTETLKTLAIDAPNRAAIGQEIVESRNKIQKAQDELKKLFYFDIPQGTMVKISYVAFGDKSDSGSIESEDDEEKKNFEFQYRVFNKSDKIFLHVNEQNELVE